MKRKRGKREEDVQWFRMTIIAAGFIGLILAVISFINGANRFVEAERIVYARVVVPVDVVPSARPGTAYDTEAEVQANMDFVDTEAIVAANMAADKPGKKNPCDDLFLTHPNIKGLTDDCPDDLLIRKGPKPPAPPEMEAKKMGGGCLPIWPFSK